MPKRLNLLNFFPNSNFSDRQIKYPTNRKCLVVRIAQPLRNQAVEYGDQCFLTVRYLAVGPCHWYLCTHHQVWLPWKQVRYCIERVLWVLHCDFGDKFFRLLHNWANVVGNICIDILQKSNKLVHKIPTLQRFCSQQLKCTMGCIVSKLIEV